MTFALKVNNKAEGQQKEYFWSLFDYKSPLNAIETKHLFSFKLFLDSQQLSLAELDEFVGLLQATSHLVDGQCPTLQLARYRLQLFDCIFIFHNTQGCKFMNQKN